MGLGSATVSLGVRRKHRKQTEPLKKNRAGHLAMPSPGG